MRSFVKVGLVLAVAFLSTTCKNENTANKDNVAVANENTEKIFPVRTVKIEAQEIARTLDYTANLVAFKEIHYAPASPGRIGKIYVEVGNKVTQGQVLVDMDKTQYNQSISQLENARFNYNSIDTLYQLGSISEQQYEQAKTQYELAKSNYNFLKDNTTLTSPINGIVTGKYFENGELYSGAPNTSAGKAAILSLMQINPLKAVVSISQTFFPAVKEGMKAVVTTDIYPGKSFDGKVYKVYPMIDASTRTFKVEIVIENNSEVLRPGMFANINLKLKDERAVVVPSIAVLKQEGTNNRYVFINNNGVAKQIEVKLGKRFDDKIELISDEIRVGEDLIIEGQSNLLDGSKISVVSE